MAATLSSLFAFSTGSQRISTLLLWLLLLAPVNAGVKEVRTLMTFKQWMNTDSSSLAKGYWTTWNGTDRTPCRWWGVTCTTTSTVEALDLSDWGLTMLRNLSLLSNLPDLRRLDFSGNNFRSRDINSTGNGVIIPDDFGSLVNLTTLILSRNDFKGTIPSSISACQKLRYLSLEKNQLGGVFPDLSGLVNLQYLYCKANNLTGSFPKWLGQLNSLLSIDLAANLFSGTIPSLSNLTSLLELRLDNNSFTGFDEPILPDASRLEQLTVSGNQLRGEIPSSITKFSNIKVLDMSRNQLSGPIPSGFDLNMSEAVWIDLSQNRLEGEIPRSLLQPTLRSINLPGLVFSNNFLSGTIPLDSTKQYNYHKLDFSYNNLTGPLIPICKNRSTYINHLYLHHNKLSGNLVDFLYECYDYVSDMRLANNSFSGDLSTMASIDPRLNSLTRAATLQYGYRDLSNNNLQMSVTEAQRDPLREVLEVLVLNTSVTDLHLQGNNFSGTPLPTSFPLSAPSLLVLDFSRNGLVGEISGGAFNSTCFPVLQVLNFSGNDLTGPIPEAVVNIPALTVLDVAYNSLSGPLPFIRDTLYHPIFFTGNPRLCGGPLTACSRGTGVRWWVLFTVIAGSLIVVMGSCLTVAWRWRVYRKMHQQDADLIKTLLERESAALMPLRELKKATDNFSEGSRVGAGGFGIVYTGKLSDGSTVAIKRSKREGSEKDKDQFLNEVRILSQVNHRHLVRLLGCCMENKVALLVFEFVSNGTLQQRLQAKLGEESLSWKQRLRIAVQTADALNYLHSATSYPIYHRDVKSANILLDDDLNAKVADFGISRLAPLEATHVSTMAIQGTIGYIDPEYYTSYQLTDKSDVYSFGVVLLELISAKPAIDFQRGGERTGLVNFALPHIESGVLDEVVDAALMQTYNDFDGRGRASIKDLGKLALKCLQNRSKVRPSMHEVWKNLQDIWLDLEGEFGSTKHVGSKKNFGSSKDVGSPKSLGSTNEDDDKKDRGHDHIVLLADSRNGSSCRIEDEDTSVQMCLYSHISKGRSKSGQL